MLTLPTINSLNGRIRVVGLEGLDCRANHDVCKERCESGKTVHNIVRIFLRSESLA